MLGDMIGEGAKQFFWLLIQLTWGLIKVTFRVLASFRKDKWNGGSREG